MVSNYVKWTKHKNVTALTSLGLKFYCGDIAIPIDKKQAYQYFKAASDKKDPTAQVYLGQYLYYGECGIETNHKRAFELFHKSLFSEGSISSVGLLNLGFCYYRGNGTLRNMFRAKEYILKALNKPEPKELWDISAQFQNIDRVKEITILLYLSKQAKDEKAAQKILAYPYGERDIPMQVYKVKINTLLFFPPSFFLFSIDLTLSSLSTSFLSLLDFPIIRFFLIPLHFCSVNQIVHSFFLYLIT